MIQCVGSRNEERPYCSRICCVQRRQERHRHKGTITGNGRGNPFQGYDDLRLSRKVLSQGEKARGEVHPVRESGAPCGGGKGRAPSACAPYDPSVMEEVAFKTDFLALSSAVIPRENQGLATLLKVPRTNEGFFLEAHMKLRPVDFASDGMFLAGLCHSPKNLRETIAQAEGAVARAITILSKEKVAAGGIVAHVEGDLCAACLTCVRVCPYSVPVINEKGEAEIDISKCKGCGSCAAECPAKAIDLMHYRDIQIIGKEQALCAE